MERCDFSSISTCLKNQISESNQMNQPDFLYELFEDFMNDPINEDFSMDNGLICRWITGQAKISPKITSYYAKPSNQKKLATTIVYSDHRTLSARTFRPSLTEDETHPHGD